MSSVIKQFRFLILFSIAHYAWAEDYPPPTEGDFTIPDFKFQSGETLPELRIHYRTLGSRKKTRRAKRPMPF
jgi:homoserine O-acetyltransferase